MVWKSTYFLFELKYMVLIGMMTQIRIDSIFNLPLVPIIYLFVLLYVTNSYFFKTQIDIWINSDSWGHFLLAYYRHVTKTSSIVELRWKLLILYKRVSWRMMWKGKYLDKEVLTILLILESFLTWKDTTKMFISINFDIQISKVFKRKHVYHIILIFCETWLALNLNETTTFLLTEVVRKCNIWKKKTPKFKFYWNSRWGHSPNSLKCH